MWFFGKNKEMKISDNFGEPYFGELASFLEKHFDAKFLEKKEIEFDLSYFEYLVDDNIITILTEGMGGTSISGNRQTVKRIIEKAKEINPKLVDRIR